MRDDKGFSRQSATSVLQYEIVGRCLGIDIDMMVPCPYSPCKCFLAIIEETQSDVSTKRATYMINLAQRLTEQQKFSVPVYVVQHMPDAGGEVGQFRVQRRFPTVGDVKIANSTELFLSSPGSAPRSRLR